MARRLLIIVFVSVVLSIQILDARHLNHERFIQRWFKWRVPGLGLEVERWKGVRHKPVKRDAPDAPPISHESESEQVIAGGESNEEGIEDLSRLPAMSKESEENRPSIARVPLEKSIAPPIFPPQIGAERFLEEPEKLLTNIKLSEGVKELLQSVGGVFPEIPKIPEPKFIEGPLKMILPLKEIEIKSPPPPPPFVQILEEPKIKVPPFFEPVIKEPEKVEIVNVVEHGPPIIEIPPPPPPPPPHPEVVIPHVIQPEIKPILVEIPPEPKPIPAPPPPPIFKPEVKPPEEVEEVKPPPPPPVPGPIAIGTKWMFLFSDMILHALSEIITGARAGFAQFTTATEQ